MIVNFFVNVNTWPITVLHLGLHVSSSIEKKLIRKIISHTFSVKSKCSLLILPQL